MTKQKLLQIISDGNYSDLKKVYDQFKIDTKRDSFYSGSHQTGSIQYNMLLKDVKAIYVKMERNNLFSSSEPVRAETISVKPLKMMIKERPKITKNPHVNYDDLPDDLKALFNDNGRYESEIKSKHALMAALPPDESFNDQRLDFISAIDKLESLQNNNWDIIDNWYAKVKEVKVDDTPTAVKKNTDLPDMNNPGEISLYIQRAKRYLDRYGKSDKEKCIKSSQEYRDGLKKLGING